MRKAKIVIDRECGRSLTDQLVDGLRSAVRLGWWKTGERLPTREEIMASCGVSRNVVQAAIRRLVAEGLVVTRPRLGCTVSRPSRRAIRGVVLEVANKLFGDRYGNFAGTSLRKIAEMRQNAEWWWLQHGDAIIWYNIRVWKN